MERCDHLASAVLLEERHGCTLDQAMSYLTTPDTYARGKQWTQIVNARNPF
jgi:hypothetical protein